MSRKFELFHPGSWTSSQVGRLVRTLVCPSCDLVDEDSIPGAGAAVPAGKPLARSRHSSSSALPEVR